MAFQDPLEVNTILIVPKIQNCYIGNTLPQISNTFRVVKILSIYFGAVILKVLLSGSGWLKVHST